MRHGIDWVKTFYRPLARRATQRVIAARIRDRLSPEKGRFTRRDVDKLLEAAWHAYDQAVPALAVQPTRGSTMNVRLACFTLSVFNALLALDIERKYAIELVADATWSVYELWARLASIAARFTPGKSTALAFAATRKGEPNAAVSLSFPFNAPGYRIEPIAASAGVAFDVVHCPVGSYFRQHGAVDLCVASWCNLDYALSELTNQKLVRTETLVQGSDRCDFRILPLSNIRSKDSGRRGGPLGT